MCFQTKIYFYKNNLDVLKVHVNYKVLVLQQNVTLHPWVIFLMTTKNKMLENKTSGSNSNHLF
jgi:hypothetical protein